jgi:hypothetical protein
MFIVSVVETDFNLTTGKEFLEIRDKKIERSGSNIFVSPDLVMCLILGYCVSCRRKIIIQGICNISLVTRFPFDNQYLIISIRKSFANLQFYNIPHGSITIA